MQVINIFYKNLNINVLIKGRSKKEIFLSTYICHPSMANNELSGPSVVTYLAKWLMELNKTDYTYRIIFIPETIGSIAYLSKNLKEMKKKIIAGFNVSCVGDNRTYSYLPSRKGETLSDEIAQHVLKWIDKSYKTYTWFDRGSDERQYCAPGIDLPVASILRTKYGEYPEYHTSLDNFDNVVTAEGLDGGYWAIRKALELEGTITGEHGVGLHKKEYLLEQHPDSIPVMKSIKRTLDPNNIMNPGKIFDLN